jgi:N6-adenosine-specific RNA methylase IME4
MDSSTQTGIIVSESVAPTQKNTDSVLISLIRKDGGTQSRVEQNQLVIDDYAEKMLAGDVFPPPTVFFDGSSYWLADGFHRVNAAIQAGFEEIYCEVKSGALRDAVLYSVGANAKHGLRRTNEDKRHVVTVLLNDEEWGKWSNVKIAEMCGVSDTFVSNIRTLLSLPTVGSDKKVYIDRYGFRNEMNTERIGKTAKITPEVRVIVKETPLADNTKDLIRLSKFEPEQQAKIVEKISSGEAETINQARKVIASEQVKATPVVEGKYRVIYADPPWKYGGSMNETYGTADKHYPTLTLTEICELPIIDLAEDNAVLFLWTTSPMLEDAFKVINTWGFTYKASFIWDKVKHVMGHYNSVRHEFLLIATRGNCVPENMKLHDSVVSIERTDHSKKPERFREIIDEIYPSGNRIELFAREKCENWDVWGNQV